MTARKKMTKNRHQNQKTPKYIPPTIDRVTSFHEHLLELRKRFFYIVISLIFWSILSYVFEKQIINALLRPAKNQQFIYTSPIGGVEFMFRVSIYAAIMLSIPVIVYNALAFIEPILSKSSRRFITVGAITSGILAACGMTFGYFVGLPSALHFLLNQFVTSQIHPLLTIQSYLAFVMVYMVGAALMLQIPLILILINRIKPLTPKQLWKQEKWVILGAFIMSGLMNPTPNLYDQLVVAGPLIIMYQIGIILIALTNRSNRKYANEEDSLFNDQEFEEMLDTPIASDIPLYSIKQKHGTLPAMPAVANKVDNVGNLKPKTKINVTDLNQFRDTSDDEIVGLNSKQNKNMKYVDGFVNIRKPSLGAH